jgi:hypothetical protein
MLPSSVSKIEVQGSSSGDRALEVAIPFIDLPGTQNTIFEAERLCSGLNAVLQVIRVLPVPFPLDVDHPPVATSAVARELQTLRSELPMSVNICLSREWIDGMLAIIPEHSLVVMTYKRRLWMTRQQKLARALRKEGRQVTMILESRKKNA